LDKVKDVCICAIKGGRLTEKETPRDSLVACHSRKCGDYFSLVRSSIEMEKAPKTTEGHLRSLVSISGMIVHPQEQGQVKVSMMCIVDTEKPLLKETLSNLDSIMLERIQKFKSYCEESK
jgi:hypothetical protein